MEQTDSVITEALSLSQEAPAATELQPDSAELPSAAKAPSTPPESPQDEIVPVAKPPQPQKKTAATPPPSTQAAADSTIKGWFVQVGSFGQEMNASGLSDRLKAAGYDSRLQKVELGKGHAYRVLVGPSSSRAAAEKLAARLKSGQQLAGMVIEYP